MAPRFVFLPEMAMTLVRRVTARLPHNHYLFRVDPKYTKSEVREYLEKVYDVKVGLVTTSISLGETIACSCFFEWVRMQKRGRRERLRGPLPEARMRARACRFCALYWRVFGAGGRRRCTDDARARSLTTPITPFPHPRPLPPPLLPHPVVQARPAGSRARSRCSTS
jgi:hypothetical protein